MTDSESAQVNTYERPEPREWPPVRWHAFVDMRNIPGHYPLRFGAKRPSDKVRLYWQARFASPVSRHVPLYRWDPVDPWEIEHELRLAVKAGYDVTAIRLAAERQARLKAGTRR